MARSPQQILQADYLIARAKVIEVAAVLDRIDRAAANVAGDEAVDGDGNTVYSDPAYQKIQNAIAILTDSQSDKTRRVQELLSRPYAANWMEQFNLPAKYKFRQNSRQIIEPHGLHRPSHSHGLADHR